MEFQAEHQAVAPDCAEDRAVAGDRLEALAKLAGAGGGVDQHLGLPQTWSVARPAAQARLPPEKVLECRANVWYEP